MPMWMLARRLVRGREGPAPCPAARRVPTNTASKPLPSSSAFRLVDRRVVADLDAHVEDHARSLRRARSARQAERRDVGAHQAAGLGVASRRSRPRSRAARGRSPPSARRARRRCRRRACRSSCAGALGRRSVMSSRRSAATRLRRQIATGFSSTRVAAASGLAGAVAGAPEDAREDVRLAVEHVRVGVAPLRDQPDVLGHVGVGRAGPLAVDDLVEVARIFDVGRLHPWGLRSTRTLDRTRPLRHGKTRKLAESARRGAPRQRSRPRRGRGGSAGLTPRLPLPGLREPSPGPGVKRSSCACAAAAAGRSRAGPWRR